MENIELPGRRPMIEPRLTGIIQDFLPGSSVVRQQLPDCPQLSLYLLNEDYPQHGLNPDQVSELMDNPLYWIFCWASGQVLSKFILNQPQWVQGKRVLDFGCGSGVVAIAAALAGASEVIACDIDLDALEATCLNADLNKVSLNITNNYEGIEGDIDLIVVADVLYDKSNFLWLDRFVERADRVLIADSRVKDFDYLPYRQIDRFQSYTLPALNEPADFRDVRIYLAD